MTGANGFDYAVFQKKRKRKKKVFLLLLSLALLFGGGFLYFQRNVTKVLVAVSEATMRASTTVAVNDAVYYTLRDGVRYEDLVEVERNGEGDITSVSANALKINRIARDTASISQSNLKNLSLNGIPIPLGALTGIEALAGVGPPIHFRIIPVSSVACTFTSGFQSVGINQTRHSIYLNVVTDISIVMPSKTENFAVVTEILIAECVLVGKIPDTFLQSDLFGKSSGLTE